MQTKHQPETPKRYGEVPVADGWFQVQTPNHIVQLWERDWDRLQRFLKATLTNAQYNQMRELEIIPTRREVERG